MMDDSSQSAEKACARGRPRSRFRMTGGIWIPPRNRDAGVIQGVHEIGGTPLVRVDLTDAEIASYCGGNRRLTHFYGA